MTNISKKKLNKDIQQKIYSRLTKAIAGIHTRSKSAQFIEDILTETERQMLAKRFAALFMLTQNVSSYRVHKLLNMSTTTTKRLSLELSQGKHAYITSVVKKKKDREKFWAELEVIVRLGMPEMGKNRWKWLDEISKK